MLMIKESEECVKWIECKLDIGSRLTAERQCQAEKMTRLNIIPNSNTKNNRPITYTIKTKE